MQLADPQEDEGEETGRCADEGDATEVTSTFWSMSGEFIYRHHAVPRVTLYVPQENSCPMPLQHIDVERQNKTKLDVLQVKIIDEFWNVDGNIVVVNGGSVIQDTRCSRTFIRMPYMDRWKIDEKTSHVKTGFCLFTSIWTTISVKNQSIAERRWQHDTPELDAALQLQGIYCLSADDYKYDELLTHAQRKLEIKSASSMLCLTRKPNERIQCHKLTGRNLPAGDGGNLQH